MRSFALLAFVGCVSSAVDARSESDSKGAVPDKESATASGSRPVAGYAPPVIGKASATRLALAGSADWVADQTDYPIEIVLHRAAGSDSGKDVYLGDNVQSDFRDVRFADAEGASLAYWIEEVRPGRATVWVKIRLIARTGNTHIVVTWGNAGAVSASDGKATFRFFESFDRDGEGNETNKNAPAGWEMSQIAPNVSWNIRSGVLRLTGGGHLTTAAKVWPNPGADCAVAGCTYTMRARAQWPTPAFSNRAENGETFGGVSLKTTDGSTYFTAFSRYQFQPKGAEGKIVASLGNGRDEATGFELRPFPTSEVGAFHIFEIERRPDKTIARLVDLGLSLESDMVSRADMHMTVHGCDFKFPTSPFLSVDWMLVRKQVSPAPGYGAWTRE